MKYRLYIFVFFCCLIGMGGCKKLSIPEEEGGKEESTSANYNQDAPVVDCDETQNSDDDVPNPGTGPFRGYNSLVDYLTFYGNPTHPIPLEDLLPEGCVYQEIMKNAKYSAIDHCYIEGYVVGFVNGTTMSKTVFGCNEAVETNLVLAASPDEKNPARCVPVQLANGSAAQTAMRQALNLADHPELLRQHVCLAGNLRYYMRTLGLQSVYDGYLDGEQAEDPSDKPDDPENPDNPDKPDKPDTPSDEPDDSTGPYHGYSSIATYLTAFSESYDKPAPFEDFLEGGCVYEEIVNNKNTKKWGAKSLWVRGFIVGVASSKDGGLEGIFEGDWTGENGFKHDSNIYLAPTEDCRDTKLCIPIELPSKTEVRKQLNLYNNPSNQGREVAVKGTVSYYFWATGIKNTTDYHFFE